MAFLYLKKQQQTNIPMRIKLCKRWPPTPEKDFTTKEPTGRNQYPYDLQDERGTQLKHYATEREEETLKLFKEGETLQVVRQEQVKTDGKRIAYNVWTTVDGIEARTAAALPLRSNVQEVTHQKHQDSFERENKIKQIMISLAGLTQAFISNGKNSPQEALDLAVSTRKMIIDKAIQLANES